MNLEMKYRDYLEKGRAEGKAQGIAEGRAEVLLNLVRKKKITIKEASSYMGITEDKFAKLL